ncbi:MAG: YCF48-related protein [Opitutaceae bacterium]|nr:YCF48-related protein [Opitutaceae bacterium]
MFALSLTFASSALAAPPPPRTLLLDVALTGPDIVAVGERGTIARSTDNGRTWETVSSPVRATLTGVAFASLAAPRTGWAVGHDAVIIGTADGGRTWAKSFQGENLNDSFLDVIALDAQRALAVGAYGLFVSTANAGKTWTRRKISDDDTHLNRISRGPGGTLYLAGERGTLLRSTDQGLTWTKLTAPYEGSFYGILPLDRRTLLAHGLRGHAFHSTDDGQTWRDVSTPAPALLATAVRLRSGFTVLAGQARALFFNRDPSAPLAASPAPPGTAIAELLELPDGQLLAVGEAGATLLDLAAAIPGAQPQPARAP